MASRARSAPRLTTISASGQTDAERHDEADPVADAVRLDRAQHHDQRARRREDPSGERERERVPASRSGRRHRGDRAGDRGRDRAPWSCRQCVLAFVRFIAPGVRPPRRAGRSSGRRPDRWRRPRTARPSHGYNASGRNVCSSVITSRPRLSTDAVCITATAEPTATAWRTFVRNRPCTPPSTSSRGPGARRAMRRTPRRARTTTRTSSDPMVVDERGERARGPRSASTRSIASAGRLGG